MNRHDQTDSIRILTPGLNAIALSDRMPAVGGTYGLVMRAEEAMAIEVGRLGSLNVVCGYYIYIGSAFGSGGLRSRVGRHLCGSERRHWHIDFLRSRIDIVEVWYTTNPLGREHQWAQAIALWPDTEIALAGFGASDCDCPSHLFYMTKQPVVERLRC